MGGYPGDRPATAPEQQQFSFGKRVLKAQAEREQSSEEK